MGNICHGAYGIGWIGNFFSGILLLVDRSQVCVGTTTRFSGNIKTVAESARGVLRRSMTLQQTNIAMEHRPYRDDFPSGSLI